MSSYYDNPEEMERRGIDPDLSSALTYNPQPFELMAIDKVLAVVEGEHDGPPWHWVIRLNDGRFIYLTGGCDYTGWDCQSSATSTVIETPEKALELIEDYNEERGKESVESLRKQLAASKSETWREGMDKVMPTDAAKPPSLNRPEARS